MANRTKNILRGVTWAANTVALNSEKVFTPAEFEKLTGSINRLGVEEYKQLKVTEHNFIPFADEDVIDVTETLDTTGKEIAIIFGSNDAEPIGLVIYSL